MKSFATGQIRNVALIAHGGAGKTSLAEAMLYLAGTTDRLGRTDDGNTVMDYDPEEIRRKISITTSIAPAEWHGHKINVVDTPGYLDFVGEVLAALRVVDTAVVVVDAVAGVEVGTELVWRYAQERNLPRLVFVSKMDRENANFTQTLEGLREAFGRHLVPISLPIGSQQNFRGIVDLINQKAWVWDGGKPQEVSIPDTMISQADQCREALLEAVAEADDELLAKYLDGEAMTPEEVARGLKAGINSGSVVPVLAGAAARTIGVAHLMDVLTQYGPSPADRPAVEVTNAGGGQETRTADPNGPLAAMVFKTMADPYVGKLSLFRIYSGTLSSDSQVYNANKGRTERIGQVFVLRGKQQEAVDRLVAGDIGAVAKLQDTSTGDALCGDEQRAVKFAPIVFPSPVYSMALQPRSKGDEDKLSSGLQRLSEEDPTIQARREPTTGQLLLSGMGDLHMEVVLERLKRKFGVEVDLLTPKVPYMETIKSTAKAEGKHKKQTGGHGQYGHVFLELEPLPGQGFEFVDKIFGGAVPKQYIPAVEKGVRETMAEGILAGYPVTDIRVILYDGSFHPVDSSEMAFKIAAALALKKGFLDANPVLLEPIMKVEVLVPDTFMGDIMGDLNKRRGRILGMEPEGRFQRIMAQVPQAHMFDYAIALRSITQGRGSYSMTFSHYEEVPQNIAETVIAEARKEKTEAKE